jgi:hypothetical protein
MHAASLSFLLLFSVTIGLSCEEPSRYCIEYRNGTLHDVLTFEMIVVVSTIVAIVGYLRAAAIFGTEQQADSLRSPNVHVTLSTTDQGQDDGSEHDRIT